MAIEKALGRLSLFRLQELLLNSLLTFISVGGLSKRGMPSVTLS